jgi:cytochrome c biogenesis protein CcdA
MSSLDECRQEIEEFERCLHDEEKNWSRKARQSIVFWCVRWAIAFVILGVLTFYRPDLIWLWWIALPLAGGSLLLLLGVAFLARRRRHQMHRELVHAKAFVSMQDDAGM